MPDRALVERTLLFLRDARNDWLKLAEAADAQGNAKAAKRARDQAAECDKEIARLLVVLGDIDA